jgi:hypothetical protein
MESMKMLLCGPPLKLALLALKSVPALALFLVASM